MESCCKALALGLPHYLGGKADIADLYLWHALPWTGGFGVGERRSGAVEGQEMPKELESVGPNGIDRLAQAGQGVLP